METIESNAKAPNIPADMDADALVDMLDALCASGSQHINLDIGEETKVQTVNSTECNPKLGPCAIPNMTLDEDADGEEPEESDDEDEL